MSSFNRLVGKSILVFILLASPVQGEDLPLASPQSYLWPLPLEKRLTSTFGEYRTIRFHAGIDLSTGGEVGFPVYAVANGYIYRVRVNKRGYGKALYLKHEDGMTSLYAHLDRFEENNLKLESRVKRAKRLEGRKEVELIFKPDELPVKRGEIIAYSGETGEGLPHLHFELWDKDNIPVNPLTNGFFYPDRYPPVIESLILKPVDDNSSICGRVEEREFLLRPGAGENNYVSATIPTLKGRIEVIVRAHDSLSTSPYKGGIYRLEAYLDGFKKRELRFDRFPFQPIPNAGLLYDLNLSRLEGERYYYKLFSAENQLLSFFKDLSEGEGYLEVEGHHTLKIVAYDASGNFAQADFPFLIQYPPLPLQQERSLTAKTNPPFLKLECKEENGLIRISVRSQEPLQEGPFASLIIKDRNPISIPLEEKENLVYQGAYKFKDLYRGEVVLTIKGKDLADKIEEIRERFVVQGFEREEGGFAYDAEGRVKIFIPPSALYRRAYINIKPLDLKSQASLPLMGMAYEFHPLGLPFDQPATLFFSCPSGLKDLTKIGIYRWDPLTLSWRYLESSLDRESQSIRAKIYYLATYALLVDQSEPEIMELWPGRGEKIRETTPTIIATVKDRGSGIDEESLMMRLDGQIVDCDYDPDRQRVTFTPEQPLPAGEHCVTIKVKDRAGNWSREALSKFIILK